MNLKRRVLTAIKLTAPVTGTILGKLYVVFLRSFFDRIVYIPDDLALIIIGLTIFSIATISTQ